MSDLTFTAAVEGPSDEAVLRKLAAAAGARIGQVYGRNGKDKLLKNLPGFNNAARFSPWIVLLDLDTHECVVDAKTTWLPEPSEFMCLRIAVRELEAWLMADAERFAIYFGISKSLVPGDPDLLPDPKQTLMNLARRSRKRSVREDIVPNQKLGQSIGPAYTARILDFVNREDGWRVADAAQVSASLRRALAEIESRVSGS